MNSRIAFGVVTCVILALAARSSPAAGRNDPAAYRLITSNQEEIIPPAPERQENGYSQNFGYEQESNGSESYGGDSYGGEGCWADGNCDEGCYEGDCYRSCCLQRWTVTADAIIWDRIGGKRESILRNARTLDEVLNSNDFDFGFRAGPRVGLIRRGDRCFDLDLSYFMIDSWSSSKIRENGEDGLLAYAESGETFITFAPLQLEYTSRLYNAEINLRWNPLCRLTMLAGFRWAELRENIFASERVLDTRTTLWAPLGSVKATNDLYGFQIGGDAKLLQYGCFSIDGIAKAGIYGNHSEQTISAALGDFHVSASKNRSAFIGEAGLQALLQVTRHLTIKAGYQVLWLDGVAVAPAQREDIQAVNTDSTVYYHGANAGLEYRF